MWMHGDGVQYGEEHTLVTYSVGSCLTNTSSMQVMFYMASFVNAFTASEQHGHAEDTWHTIWAVLLWSFKAAWEGHHPLVDWENRPFEA